MKKVNLLLLVAASSLAAFSGCTLSPQIKYDHDRMPSVVGESGRVLQPGEPVPKGGVTTMLGGRGFNMDPSYFVLDTNKVAPLFAPSPEALVSFIVIADPQIDDRGMRFSPAVTQFIDKRAKIETTVRGIYQDHADVFYLGFVLKAIRLGLVVNTNIAMVVHLGDAMQVGRKSELAAFNEMMGKFLIAGRSSCWEESWSGTWLKTPILLPDRRECWWFNLIGNHDVRVLGNFPRNLPIRVPGGAIGSPAELQAALEQTPPFDAACRPDRRPVLGVGTAEHGYYWIDRQLPDGRLARLVMLNTSEGTLLDPLIPKLYRGALYPSLSGEQFDWLRHTLDSAQTNESVGLVLVFGHYPLMEVTVNRTVKRPDRDRTYEEVNKLLGEFSKVNAYFCGHLHSGGPPKEHRFNDHTFVEYICPSLQEYPKSFGLASVCKDPLSGKYSTRVKYHNLEDVLDLASLPPVEVGEESPPYDQQTRLADWLVALDNSTTNMVERVQLLADYCYRSSIYDLQRDLRTDISLCFNPKLRGKLLQEYSGCQEFWLQLKREPYWPMIQMALETRLPSTFIAQSTITPRAARKAKYVTPHEAS